MTTTNITDLPPELMIIIYKYLPNRRELSHISRNFYTANCILDKTKASMTVDCEDLVSYMQSLEI
jgi:hypothetical protein